MLDALNVLGEIRNVNRKNFRIGADLIMAVGGTRSRLQVGRRI